MIALFELIKRCLDSGYELSFKKELGNISIKVVAKNYSQRYIDDEGNEQKLENLKHQCEQIIPNNNHLYKMNGVTLFCIEKVDELIRQNRELLKLKNGRTD